jgi:hypothetical protein
VSVLKGCGSCGAPAPASGFGFVLPLILGVGTALGAGVSWLTNLAFDSTTCDPGFWKDSNGTCREIGPGPATPPIWKPPLDVAKGAAGGIASATADAIRNAVNPPGSKPASEGIDLGLVAVIGIVAFLAMRKK